MGRRRSLFRVGGFAIALVDILRDVSALNVVNHCNPLPARADHSTCISVCVCVCVCDRVVQPPRGDPWSLG